MSYRTRQQRHEIESDDVNRWLVSYADYMTLLFALFVVLYAMALIHDKPFETVTESIGKVFQANEEAPKNRGQGEGVLDVNTVIPNEIRHGNGILDVPGPELMEGDKMLSNVNEHKLGATLSTLEDGLQRAIFDLVENGFAQMQIDGDWLVIELSNDLLFPSGSTSVIKTAKQVLAQISGVIDGVNNYIRIRGYTDNQPISTEIFASNWELSVYRATAILKELESLDIDPRRMAIEGYGQHSPTADNSTAEGRAQNRKVAIAISKYGFTPDGEQKPPVVVDPDVQAAELTESINQQNNTIKIRPLENGGVIITTRDEDKEDSPPPNDEN